MQDAVKHLFCSIFVILITFVGSQEKMEVENTLKLSAFLLILLFEKEVLFMQKPSIFALNSLT